MMAVALEFRKAMRRYPTGVTVVTTVLDGKLKGFTANAFASVSAEPPTILICVNRTARTHALISQAGRFCVNVLRLDQRPIAERFSKKDDADPFASLPYSFARTGAPVLDGVLSYFDCELAEEHSAATHTIFIGNVLACEAHDGAPLGYFDAGYRDFGCSTT
ncbi:MAG: flavin reductase family protein [Candidatus Eremiobacteraeota bacterium]|nr:flavin reductase family protein [Candidatus Eremiobacteraeota bacterium]